MNFKRFGRTAQLFEYTTMSSGVTGYYLKSDGSTQNEGSWNISDYIPCDGDEFTINAVGGNSPSICLYDENKTFIKGQAYNTGGAAVKASVTITSTTQAKYIRFSYMKETYPDDLSAIMLNEGSTALPYQPYKDWTDTPHYIHNTSTDIITTPAVLYPNDNNATVGLKGNMEQSGTPTPTNPIQPSECGERTGNLCDESQLRHGYFGNTSPFNFTADEKYRCFSINLTAGTYSILVYGSNLVMRLLRVSSLSLGANTVNKDNESYTFTIDASETVYITFRNVDTTIDFSGLTVMFNTGETIIPYEPYGIKIPILSNSTTMPVYLGEVPTTRKIKKSVLTGTEDWRKVSDVTAFYTTITDTLIATNSADYIKSSHYQSSMSGNNGTIRVPNNASRILIFDNYSIADDFKAFLAAQYAAGTPVTIWYVLATPETAVVNEPIRKIGDYADEVSGITIPTIAGANIIDVDTTLKPSEVTATYKGWHPVTDVHECENGAWT